MMSLTSYDENYLTKRRTEIDRTEFYDILLGLKAVKARKDEKIVELGAGEGYLIDFLRKKRYNVIGVDLLGDGKKVLRLNLEREFPPEADIYIFQHLIEHLNQNRARELLEYCIIKGRAIIGICPAHHVDDPTHVVNHYEYEELEEFISGSAPYYHIRPDLLSYIEPKARDWLVVLSKTKIKNSLPFLFGIGILALKGYLYVLSPLLRRW